MLRSRAGLRTLLLSALVSTLVSTLLVIQPALPSRATGEGGDLDLSFGSGGRVVGGFDGSARAVALQPDGKIVIAGSIDWKPGYPGLGVVRYNPDGTLDRSFGRSGIAVTGILGRDADPAAVVVQPDGEIVVGGRSPAEGEGSRAFALARFDPDGTLDRSFGKKGIVATDFFGGEQAVTDLVLQPDGKIVAGGYASRPTSPTSYRFALARYRRDGTLDRSFGNGGKVVTKLVPRPSFISALALQPDGKIVAGGGTRGKLALVRYLPDGTLDPAFGTAGAVLTDFGRYESLSDLVVLPGGTIVAGGATTPRGGGLNARVLALAGYRPDGNLDPTFGSGGKVLTDLPGKQEGVAGLAAQPDGKIVTVGGVIRPAQRPSALMVVARYEGDGDLDAGFGTGGVVTTAARGNSGAADVALQLDGRIVVVGTTVSPRLNEAGYPIWSYFVAARSRPPEAPARPARRAAMVPVFGASWWIGDGANHMQGGEMSHTGIADAAAAVLIQPGAVVSKVIYRDESLNVTVFGFDAGEGLTEHRAGHAAIVQVLSGRLRFTADGEELDAGPGFWLHMASGTPHALVATEPTVMLLTLVSA